MSSRGRVLLVDDDPRVAQDFRRILERGGFEISWAASAEDALRFHEENRADVVLIDFESGGAIDGRVLAAALEAIAPAAFVPVMAFLDAGGMDQTEAVPAYGCLVEPIGDRQLLSTVQVALRRFRAQQETESVRLNAENELGDLLNAIPDPMVVVGADGRILVANIEVERQLGHSVAAIQGQPIEILVPAALRAQSLRHRDWYTTNPHSRCMGELLELEALRADGSTQAVDVSLTPIGSGPNMRVLAILRDASARRLFKQVVSERRELAEQFGRALRFETVGRLAGGIAHDFNNLLMVIGGYTDSLLRDTSAPAARRGLEGIRTAVDRAAALTRQLLAFGRRQVLQPTIVDPNAAVASVQAMLTRVIGEDIQIVTTCGRSLKRVKVDPSQIEQVLLNLSLNARDAMPNGGILRFEVNNLEVLEPLPLPSSVAVVPRGQYVMLAVCDNGLGMEQEVAARAFEPFFTTKLSGKGTGLGLSTVYGIVKQSDGFIWIESVPGAGTSVYVLLPATLEAAAVVEPVPQDRVLPRGTGTVLLVEDEPEVRAMLVESLMEAGYGVMEKANGRDAIEAFREIGGRVDLIVTDVIMPHSNGPALVRAARLHQPDVKALYMSGYADDPMVAEIQGNKHSGYLQKPFSVDVFLRRIAEMLASHPD